MILKKIITETEKLKNEDKALIMASFHSPEIRNKEVFWGISIKQLRQIAKKHQKEVSILEIKELLSSSVHELKLLAIELMFFLYQDNRFTITQYLSLTSLFSGWDLVDFSAPRILGDYLLKISDKEKEKIVLNLVSSTNLWTRRVGIVSIWPLIKKGKLELLEKIIPHVIFDERDLIQKALGWMIREGGKVSPEFLSDILSKHLKDFSTITFSYAIEKLSLPEKKYWREQRKK